MHKDTFADGNDCCEAEVTDYPPKQEEQFS